VETLGNVLLIVFGIVVVINVVDAAIRTFVVPRGFVVTFTYLVFRGVRALLSPFTHPARGYEARDRVMALYAPLALLAIPATSLLVVFAAYACIYVGLEHESWHDAFITSGSSLLTLGFVRPPDLATAFVAFSEAAIGLGILALVIAYLPTIYGAFSRRELAVSDLSVRAGNPPTPREWLVRAQRTGFLDDMDRFWDAWMAWFTELGETHTSLAALAFFRSPNPHRSWVTAAGAVLDTASIRLAALDLRPSAAAPLCIRSGYVALRELGSFFGYDVDHDPAPDDPISIARSEFDEVYLALQEAGLPMKPDIDQAWRDFAGWRVNYDQVLHALAAHTMAPYAPWISDRSPRRPPPRYGFGRRRRELARRTGTQPVAM
jgi:hypothetical protein